MKSSVREKKKIAIWRFNQSHVYIADALADAYEAGLVKTVGVSNYSKEEISRMHKALAKRGLPLASNQIAYSLTRTIPEKSGLIKHCHDLGVAILAYSRKYMSKHKAMDF